MRKFTWVLFVIVLVVVAFFTFRHQPLVPGAYTEFTTQLIQSLAL